MPAKRFGATLGACLLAGCPTKQTPPATPPTVETPAAAVDAERMFATVTELASDGLGGRYSLHTSDITRAATYIARSFEDAGLAPVGGRYQHTFPILVGAELGSPPRVQVTGRKRAHIVDPAAFAPLHVSPSGDVSGEVVFVGHAARADAAGDRRGYDDLDGIDLHGKVALVLLDAPKRPNLRTFYPAVRAVRDAFEAKAKPLREAGDTDALTKLHRQARAELATIVGPFLRGNAIDEGELGAPADPRAELPLEPFTDPVFAQPADENEPDIGFRQLRLRTKLKRLHEAGAVAAIVVRGPATMVGDRDTDELPALQGRAATSPAPMPVVQMRWRTADRLFRIGRRSMTALQQRIATTMTPQSGATGSTATLHVDVKPLTKAAPNVLAMIPGAKRPEEIVVLGAHYDHIGTDEDGHGHCRATERGETVDAICNGADDNASGTAVVMEVARVLADNGHAPDRTLVFALFAAEELGLHGSAALANDPPRVAPFADGTVVAMVNIDMVGRLGDKGLAIGGVGSSSGWMQLFDEVGTFGIPTLYDRSVTTRSDHANFYRHEIPVVFLFTGTHDDYHAPGDEAALINRQGLASIASLTHAIMARLGAGAPIPFVKPANASEGLVRALPGDNPSTVEKRVGF